MKKNSLKYLSVALALSATLTLASCDKFSNLISSPSSSSTSTTQTTTSSNNTTSESTNSQDTTVKSDSQVALTTTEIANSLANAKDLDPKTVLKNLDLGYTPYLRQVAGLKLDSQEIKGLNSFVENYNKTENANLANNSLYHNFANDLHDEVSIFTLDNPTYGYPALPIVTNDQAKDEQLYKEYKQKLVNHFLQEVDGRLKVYHNSDFQKKFFNAEQKDIPALLTEADHLVANYKTEVNNLTKGKLACDKLEGLNNKSKCFRDYLALIANYPTTLNAVNENDTNAVTPDFLNQSANSIVKFENAYLTSPEAATKPISQVTSTVDAAKTAVSHIASEAKDTAASAVNSIKESASKVVSSVTNKVSSVTDSAKKESKSALETAKEKASSTVETAKDAITNRANSVVSTVKNTADSVVESAKEKANSVVKTVKEKSSNLVDKAKNLVSTTSGKTVAVSTGVAGTTATLAHNMYSLNGYSYSLEKAKNLLSNVKSESAVNIIRTLNDVYPDVISQIAGFEHNSHENLTVVKFGKSYKENQAKNNSLFSLYNVFASDVNNEVFVFTSTNSSTYPSLPTTEEGLTKYRDELVDTFIKALQERLKVYHDTGYQKKYLQYKDQDELETLLNNADNLVGSYISLVQMSTIETPKACTVGSVEEQAKCFRNYLEILGEYPTVLLNSYFAEYQQKNAVVSPDFLNNTVESVVTFVKSYNK